VSKLLEEIEKSLLRKEKIVFEVGDLVEVHYLIREGDKERIQVFTGTVIGRQHGGMRESFAVRRIVAGEGVERVFPVNSPRVVEVRVKRRGKVRRAKLYYLRDRVGKATRLRERRKTGAAIEETASAAAAPAAEATPAKAEAAPPAKKER
jgi:large subunit ribosomal protein L19